MLEEFVCLPEFILVSTIVLIGSVRPNQCLGVTLFYYFRFIFVTRENYSVERKGNLLTKILLLHVFNVSTPVHHYAITPVRHYASMPVDVCQYASMSVRQYTSRCTPVRQYASCINPNRVDIDKAFEAYVPLEHAEPEDGLGHQDPSKPERFIMPPTEHPTVKPTTKVASTPVPIKNAVSPKKGMAARNARVRKQPKKYPSMKGNKYAVALTQIKMSLYGSEDALSMAQRSVKFMSKGLHRCADIVDMIMVQLSMKAGIKKWG